MESALRDNLLIWLDQYGLETLEEKDIRVSSDSRYPNLFNLKYGSILADKNDPIVRACRGAVVERVDNDGDHSPYFRLVAYAFDRFFNLGEGACHELDWSKTRVYEKYDGSLIKLFNYKGEWIVSTSGTVAAASEVGETGRTFAELFWLVFDEVGYSRDSLNPELCYIFELCHIDNRIVVKYETPELPLLAVRDRSQGFAELPLESFSGTFNVARSYKFGDMAAVQVSVNCRGADHEGFILVDPNGRAKSKSDVYVQLHRVCGNGKPSFSELYLNDDLEEFLLHFPDYRDIFQPLLDKLEEFAQVVNATVEQGSDMNQKEFASWIVPLFPKLSGAMFAIRAGKARDFAHYLESQNSKQLDRLLDIA